ncbi:MAG TPA: hypothetical protein VFY23_04340, partial [Candidatus Limnocylindrales bacterium]|nr:hypothetical protein [Candidatus Limnocylindrales bacterium]
VDGSEEDVEGHRNPLHREAIPTEGGPEGEGYNRNPRLPNVDGSEEDVEGHRNPLHREAIPTEGGPEGIGNDRYKGQRLDGGEDDVEGHIYTGGPSTQGEFAKRGPGENPHGDRLR